MVADSPEGRQPELRKDAKLCVSTELSAKRQEGGLRTMSGQPDRRWVGFWRGKRRTRPNDFRFQNYDFRIMILDFRIMISDF